MPQIDSAGVRTYLSLGGMAAVSDTWRTTLVFLQLRRHGIPARGMRLIAAFARRGVPVMLDAMIDRQAFQAWIDGYERAWRSPGTVALRELFTEDAGYHRSPYADPVEGLDAIARMWEGDRDGPDEIFTMAAEIVAVEGDTGVARVLVRYGDPVDQEYTDLWVVRFAADGRCSSFEEWPFWPGQPWTNAPDQPF